MPQPNGMGTALWQPVRGAASEVFRKSSAWRTARFVAFDWVQRWRAHCRLGGQSLEAGRREAGPDYRAGSDDFLLFDDQ